MECKIYGNGISEYAFDKTIIYLQLCPLNATNIFLLRSMNNNKEISYAGHISIKILNINHCHLGS